MSLTGVGCDPNDTEVPVGADPHVNTSAEALVSVATIDQDNELPVRHCVAKASARTSGDR
ncbi:MAG: hypothetical protein ABIV13_04760 [Fimbriimonadales bacterium]